MSPPAQNARPRPSPGDPATPEWSSGRSLTESQRSRKREVDRIRSRKHRQSTLTRITELEAKLQSVLAGESDSRLKQRKPLGEWNEGLNSIANQINPAASQSSDGDYNHQIHEGVSHILSEREWSSEHHFPIQGGCHGPQCESAMHLNHLSETSDNLSNTTTAFSFQFPRDITLGPNIGPTLSTTSALQGITQTFENVRQFQKAEICVDDQINQNAFICAVTKGWDALGSHGKLCPLWGLLQRCDYLIFRRASRITRLVMLWIIHQMLLFKVCGKRLDQLPHWYRPRPTQAMFPHDEITDFFAWPGMRERLVLSKEDWLTDDFWECFSKHFRFVWPFPFEDMYAVHLCTGRFYFSTLFENQLQDLTTWQMERQFFMLFPQLADDIKVAQSHSSEFSVGPGAIQMPFPEHNFGQCVGSVGFDQVQAFDTCLVLPPESLMEDSSGLASFDGSNCMDSNLL